MDIPAIEALLEHWQAEPPADRMLLVIGTMLGYKAPERRPRPGAPPRPAISPDEQRRQAEELMGMFGIQKPGDACVVR